MILTCPACTTRYLVAEGAVGPKGRRVRCANCGNQWHQAAEEGLDTELFNEDDMGDIAFAPDAAFISGLEEDLNDGFDPVPAAERPPVPRLDDEDEDDLPGGASDFSSILRKELDAVPIPEGVKPAQEEHDPVLAQLLKDKSAVAGKKKRSRLVGFATAAVFYALIITPFFLLHEPISRAWPPANLLYSLVGIPPSLPGEGLALEDLRAETLENRLLLKGEILNLKSQDVTVPSVMAAIIDANGEIIERILIAPPVARLKAEGRTNFDVVFPSVPEKAANVTFAFSFIKAEPPEEKALEEEAPTAEEQSHAPESAEDHVPAAAEHAPEEHAPAAEHHEPAPVH